MAINPNTDFTSGAILTAAQQNQFPRGIMQLATSTTSPANVTATEVVQLTATFTAVANRYYKIIYFEPDIGLSGAGTVTVSMRIRSGTTIAGTALQTGFVRIDSSAVDQAGMIICYKTFGAGAQSVVATLQASAVNAIIGRSATSAAYLTVEDVGPA
jgi:hypothetical protein